MASHESRSRESSPLELLDGCIASHRAGELEEWELQLARRRLIESAQPESTPASRSERLTFFQAMLDSFGPDEGLVLDRATWRTLRKHLESATLTQSEKPSTVATKFEAFDFDNPWDYATLRDEYIKAREELMRSHERTTADICNAAMVFKKQWQDADPEALEPWYSHWVGELTAQGLHAKADIATVLAILSQRLASTPSASGDTESAKWKAAYERANAEVFRLAELLRKADPKWGTPMNLNATDSGNKA